MKRKLLLVTLTLLMIGVVAGCGRKPMTEEERFAAELNNYFEEEAEKYEKEKVEREKEKAQNEKIKDTFKTYDVSPEWENLNDKNTGIQIDDTVYYAGMTFEQVKNALESSEVDYEYELNDKQLVTAHEEVRILVKRENLEWFYIYFRNVWDETKNLSEIPVVWVYRAKDSSSDCDKYYGYTDEEILDVKYEDIENFILELYGDDVEVTVYTHSGKYNEEDCIIYETRFGFDEYEIAKEGLWTGYNILIKNPITIYLSKATSEVVGYSVNPTYAWVYAKYPMSTEITDYNHQMDTLLEEGLTEFKTDNPDLTVDNASIVGAFIGKQYEIAYSFNYLAIILEMDVDNTKKYTLVTFSQPYVFEAGGEMDIFGNFIYSYVDTYELYDSFEETMVYTEEILSKTF